MNTHLIGLITITIGCVYSAPNGCGGSFDGADTCMQTLLLVGNPHFKFPLNRPEMATHCGTIVGAERCVKEYSMKCLDTFSRQVTSVLVNGAVKTHRGYCSTMTGQESFVAVGECLNVRKQALDQLMYDFIDTNVAINTAPQNSMKIPLMCCNFNEYKSQVLAVVRDGSAGDPKCTDETAVEVNKMLDGFADDVLNMICPKEYSSDADVADKCQPIVELTPKPVAPLSPRPKSLLMPLVNIFNSLKSQ